MKQTYCKKTRQRIVLVQASDYEELISGINDWINTLEDTMEIEQINYFSMEEDQGITCSAFILFNPKKPEYNNITGV